MHPRIISAGKRASELSWRGVPGIRVDQYLNRINSSSIATCSLAWDLDPNVPFVKYPAYVQDQALAAVLKDYKRRNREVSQGCMRRRAEWGAGW
jgi:hypothetical protein